MSVLTDIECCPSISGADPFQPPIPGCPDPPSDGCGCGWTTIPYQHLSELRDDTLRFSVLGVGHTEAAPYMDGDKITILHSENVILDMAVRQTLFEIEISWEDFDITIPQNIFAVTVRPAKQNPFEFPVDCIAEYARRCDLFLLVAMTHGCYVLDFFPTGIKEQNNERIISVGFSPDEFVSFFASVEELSLCTTPPRFGRETTFNGCGFINAEFRAPEILREHFYHLPLNRNDPCSRGPDVYQAEWTGLVFLETGDLDSFDCPPDEGTGGYREAGRISFPLTWEFTPIPFDPPENTEVFGPPLGKGRLTNAEDIIVSDILDESGNYIMYAELNGPDIECRGLVKIGTFDYKKGCEPAIIPRRTLTLFVLNEPF